MKILDIKALEGANYFSLRPVIVMALDLEEYNEVFTSSFPGFAEKLLASLPSIYEHKCSKGVRGGFISRVREGTLLGHVIEHIAIELQCIAFMKVGFGKTRSAGKSGVYNVVYSYWVDKAGILAGIEAFNLVESILNNRDYDVEKTIKKLLDILDEHKLGPSTAAIIDETEHRNITVLRLDRYDLIQLGEGKYQKRIKGTITSDTSFVGVETAGNKALTTRMLRDAGIPVPRNDTCADPESAKKLAETIGYPVVVKPLDGHHGRGVTVGVDNELDLRAAFERAMDCAHVSIVEQMLPGADYRLLVIDGKFIAAIRRIPAHLIGDGKHTISELIEIENRNPRRGFGHEKAMTRLAVSPATEVLLQQHGYTLDTVLSDDQRFDLELRSNLSTGGSAEDVTDDVHPTNRRIAERAAKIIGLDVAGIDIISPCISASILENGGAVIEVNASPDFRAHLFPSEGTHRNVATPLVDMLFPSGTTHDIPIISVTGTNGKTTTVRLAAHLMKTAGFVVGMSCTDGMYIAGRQMAKGDRGDPYSAGVVLRDPTIDCAVLETARAGMLKYGLGYKNADVGIVLNVREGQRGFGNIRDLDDLAYLKALVAEVVRSGGSSVLNADDPRCVEMTARCYERIVFFTMDPENEIIVQHVDRGGTAVVNQNGFLALMKGETVTPVARTTDISMAFEGLAEFNIQNAMAAIAAAHSLGVKVETIREGLLSFLPSYAQNPGRTNIFPHGNHQVMIDCGHTASAHGALASFLAKSSYKRILVVMCPGVDQDDDDIASSGESMAGIASEIFLYINPSHLSDREPHRGVQLLAHALESAGMGPDVIHHLDQEDRAIASALDAAQPRDLILILTSRADHAMGAIRHTRNAAADHRPTGTE